MKKSYSYIRFSSTVQEKGNSLERQQELLDNFLKVNPDHQLQELTFHDLGISGYSGSHIEDGGALKDFLTACEKGLISRGSYLLVESIDRLGRLHGADFLTLLLNLFKYVTIITLEDNQKYNRDSFNNVDAYVLQAKIQQAHNYSKQLSSRLLKSRQATRNKVLAGELNKVAKTCPSWLTYCDKSDSFLPIPNRVEIIKNIFDSYIAGAGVVSIARKLNEKNTPSFNGKGWHSSYIQKILFDRKVIGEMSGRGKQTFSNYYPQVVPTDKFLQVQSLKELRQTSRQHTTATSRPLNIYEDVVVCACGKPCKLRNKGNRQLVFICPDKERSICNLSDSWRYDTLIFHIKMILENLMLKNSVDLPVTLDTTPALEKEIENLTHKIKQYRLVFVGCTDEEEAAEIKSELDSLREDLNNKKLELTHSKESQSILDADFELGAIINHSVEMDCYLRGEIPPLLVHPVHAARLQKYLSKTYRITLSKPCTAKLKLCYDQSLLLTLKRPYLRSQAVTSSLPDGTLYLDVAHDGNLEFGDGYEHPQLPDERTFMFNTN